MPVCSSFSVRQALLDGHDEGGSTAMLGSIATACETLFDFSLRLVDCCEQKLVVAMFVLPVLNAHD